jgi:hypothetical protein
MGSTTGATIGVTGLTVTTGVGTTTTWPNAGMARMQAMGNKSKYLPMPLVFNFFKLMILFLLRCFLNDCFI